jgi:membrane protease YdiL (CAAX protease family)
VVYVGAMLAGMRNLGEALVLSQMAVVLAPPVALAAIFQLRWRPTFRLYGGGAAAALLALPLGLGAHVLLGEMMYALRQQFALPPEFGKAIEDLLDARSGFTWALFALAIVPALAEELMFRGFVLSGLRTRMGVVRAVAWSGVLFGLFHLNVYQFVYAAPAGVLLAFLAVRSRSLLGPILLHLTNNLLGVFMMRADAWPERLRRAVLSADAQHYAAWTVPVAAALVLLAMWLLWRVTKGSGFGVQGSGHSLVPPAGALRG